MSPHENFFFEDRPVILRGCDRPGCPCAGDYRAPKSRELTEYFWFCLDHVREYNKSWDYFAGMSPDAIEAHIRSASVWERPTWPMGDWKKNEQDLRDRVRSDFFDEGSNPNRPDSPTAAMGGAEREAMAILALSPPVTYVEIKAQYRLLVKRHHPDANGGAREAEEKFKSINQAFAVLKQIYNMDDGD